MTVVDKGEPPVFSEIKCLKEINEDEEYFCEMDATDLENDGFIFSVLGSKPSEYLQTKGVQPGPEMGKRIRELRQIILENKDKTPEKIRALLAGINYES